MFILILGFAGCDKDEEPNPIPENIRKVNRFVLDNMNTYYLWTEYIPPNTNPEQEPDPFEYFDKLLYKLEDRWSFITDDYESLVNSISGINLTFGHQLGLFLVEENSDQVIGIVEYVIPDSPASDAGLQRGDIIYSINGTQLTTENYKTLLFTYTSYTIGFGEIQDGTIVDSGESISLTAIILQENPVHYYDIIEYESHKIGYLVYNRFTIDFEEEVELALKDLQDAGMTDLILDLRYNPGGSVKMATKLGSMIAPAAQVNNEEVFVRYIWNDYLESFFLDEEGEDSPNLVEHFEKVVTNLDLQRLFVIISENSASASELIINCLKPYMDVTLIGTTSHGKYTGSITIQADKDEINNWAIQPIVLRVANSEGVTNYKDGFTPDYLVEDNLFIPLGNLEEDMLAQAVSVITGIPIDLLTRKEIPIADLLHRKLVSVTNRPVLEDDDLIIEFKEPEFIEGPAQ